MTLRKGPLMKLTTNFSDLKSKVQILSCRGTNGRRARKHFVHNRYGYSSEERRSGSRGSNRRFKCQEKGIQELGKNAPAKAIFATELLNARIENGESSGRPKSASIPISICPARHEHGGSLRRRTKSLPEVTDKVTIGLRSLGLCATGESKKRSWLLL